MALFQVLHEFSSAAQSVESRACLIAGRFCGGVVPASEVAPLLPVGAAVTSTMVEAAKALPKQGHGEAAASRPRK